MDAASRFKPDEIERGRLLFARPIRFLMGVAKLDQLPDTRGTEIAFAGRSNVGKSTLINALAGRHDLARTSNTPGRTRELNYFETEGGLVFVDMPGYGYARADKKSQAGWQRLIRAYLEGRPGLRRVFLLVDARHGLTSPDERIMDRLDDAAVSYQVVLTKSDKISPPALAETAAATARRIGKRPAAHPEIHATSGATGLGLAELRAEIAAL
jgi:GTP-binding protein